MIRPSPVAVAGKLVSGVRIQKPDRKKMIKF